MCHNDISWELIAQSPHSFPSNFLPHTAGVGGEFDFGTEKGGNFDPPLPVKLSENTYSLNISLRSDIHFQDKPVFEVSLATWNNSDHSRYSAVHVTTTHLSEDSTIRADDRWGRGDSYTRL